MQGHGVEVQPSLKVSCMITAFQCISHDYSLAMCTCQARPSHSSLTSLFSTTISTVLAPGTKLLTCLLGPTCFLVGPSSCGVLDVVYRRRSVVAVDGAERSLDVGLSAEC